MLRKPVWQWDPVESNSVENHTSNNKIDLLLSPINHKNDNCSSKKKDSPFLKNPQFRSLGTVSLVIETKVVIG